MNCLIIAGEKSGEDHCMSFFKQLKADLPDCSFWGVGGDEMQQAGIELLYHIRDFCSWGFSEVIFKIPFYYRAFNHILKEVEKRDCKTAILIDFQDFNLRLAERLNSMGIRVLYYVAPQAWAWKAYRAKIVEENVHTLFTILPFEKEWFTKRGVSRVVSVDHPLWQTYKGMINNSHLGSEAKKFEDFKDGVNLLLLPGSRNFEVENLLPLFLEAAKKINPRFKIKLSIVEAPNVKPHLYAQHRQHFEDIFSSNQLGEAMLNADFCFAASGTVTLATALFEVPTVIAYKTTALNAFIYKTFIKYNGPVGLVNIVHGKMICPELLQDKAEPSALIEAIEWWLMNHEAYNAIKKELAKTKKLVQGELPSVAKYIRDVIDVTKRGVK